MQIAFPEGSFLETYYKVCWPFFLESFFLVVGRNKSSPWLSQEEFSPLCLQGWIVFASEHFGGTVFFSFRMINSSISFLIRWWLLLQDFNGNTTRAFERNTALLCFPRDQGEDQEITYGRNMSHLKTIWSGSLRINSVKISFSRPADFPSSTDTEAHRRLMVWSEDKM